MPYEDLHPEGLLKLRKENEDWVVPEYPITVEATRGADPDFDSTVMPRLVEDEEDYT